MSGAWIDHISYEVTSAIYKSLTRKQQEYLECHIQASENNGLIAQQMGISDNTIRSHRAAIYGKIKKYLEDKSKVASISDLKITPEILTRIFKPILFPEDELYSKEVIHNIIRSSSLSEGQINEKIFDILHGEGDIDVDEKDERGCSPLMVAVENRKVEVVRCLIENGADINCRNKYGWTPLHKAANLGSFESVRLLIDTGKLEVDLRTKQGATPVYEAAFGSDKVQIVRLLEEKGFNILKESNDHFTPLMVAIWRQNHGIADYLIKRIISRKIGELTSEDKVREYLNRTDYKGETALYKAVRAGNYQIVKKLIDAGVDPAIEPYSTGYFIAHDLLKATERDDFESVERTINSWSEEEKERLIDQTDPDYGRSALSIAAEKGSRDIVQFLLKNGADVFSENNHGRTPRDMTLERNEYIRNLLKREENKRKRSKG